MTQERMRTLFAAALFEGSTGRERLRALRAYLDCDLIFDLDPYIRYHSRLSRSIQHHLGWGPHVWALNRDLARASRDADHDLVWVEKGVWVYPETVEILKRDGKALIVHYATDALIHVNRTRHFMRSLPLYDALITSKSWEVDLYKQHGAKKVVCVPQGVNTELFKPYDVSDRAFDEFRSDVCFIGRSEPHYVATAKAVHRLGVDFAIWGPWGRSALLHPWIKRVWRKGSIWHEAYAKALCCAKIGLGLLSKYVGDTATTRTFEITATGTFLLAERTDEHLSLFEEGVEADFFSTTEEMCDKIRYYVRHDSAREKIAAAGRQRVLRDGYDNAHRMRECLQGALGPLSGA